MRVQAICMCILLMLSSGALAQSFEMTIHLSNGETVTIPHADIRRIEFTNIGASVWNPADPGNTLYVSRLLLSYPNPFSPSTTIEYEIPDRTDVTVRIFDLKGALVRELANESQAAGRHRVVWDGTDDNRERVASGVYFCAVKYGELTFTRQLILIK